MQLQEIIGVILIGFGLLLILLGVLAWAGVIKPRESTARASSTSILDFLLALLDKAPWVVVVGLFLVVVGVFTMGIRLPF
jgi:uncharacterized membrane protein YidH (DUF202 family)